MWLSNLRAPFVATLALGAVVGCTSTTSSVGIAASSPLHKGVEPAAALKLAGSWSTTYTYTLSDISSCQITDALTVIENQLADPVRLKSVNVSMGDDSPGSERISATVAAYKAETTTGAIGATATLAPLRDHRLLPAVGAVLAPFARSRAWYEVVLHIDVLGAHPSQWSIDGVSVEYTVGNKDFTKVFPQSVKLAPVNNCPS